MVGNLPDTEGRKFHEICSGASRRLDPPRYGKRVPTLDGKAFNGKATG